MKENMTKIKKMPNHDNLFTKKLLISSTKGQKYINFLVKKASESGEEMLQINELGNSRFLTDMGSLQNRKESNFSKQSKNKKSFGYF